MPDLTIHIDREALARYGLNASDVRQGVEAGGSGAVISRVIDGQKRYDVAMRLGGVSRIKCSLGGKASLQECTLGFRRLRSSGLRTLGPLIFSILG